MSPNDTALEPDRPVPSRRDAVKFIVLVGTVSLFADVTYEGARSITGSFLAVLGASALAVGAVAGAGELCGYAIRLVTGPLADRTGRYWAITVLGYAINLFAVPFLALAGHWEVAAALMIAERVGKGIRSPARDAMLSHACSRTGLGWGFGLHEALDQVGAVSGPLIVSLVLFLHDGYRTGFALLAIPAVIALVVLLAARSFYPNPREFETAAEASTDGPLPGAFWVYLVAVALIGAGYADFALISYHFEKARTVAEDWIPVMYAIAMGADALAALALGRLFDRFGVWAVIGATVAAIASIPLAFLGGLASAAVGMILWGTGMAAQESVMRAIVTRFAPAARRGTTFGVFNAVYGVAWFGGSTLLGALYDRSVMELVVVAMALQAASLPILWSIRRSVGGTR